MSRRGFVDWRGWGTQLKEVAYGDGVSVIDSAFKMEPGPVTQELNNLFTDAEEVTELEEVSETQELSRSSALTQAMRATPHGLAYFGTLAWGQVISTEVASLAAGRVYKHEVVLTTTPALLPSVGWVDHNSGKTREYNGGIAARMAITGERNGHIRNEVDVIGSGSFTDVSTTKPALLTAEPFLRTGNTKVWLGTGTIGTSSLAQSNTVSDISGPPTDLKCVLDSFNYEINNNPLSDEGYGFGSGTVRCQHERGARTQTLGFTMEHDGSLAEVDRMLAQTNLAMEIENQSGVEIVAASGFFYGFNLAFPRVRYITAALGGGRGKATVEITAQPLEQATNTLNQRAAMLTVWNATSGYAG